MRLNSFGEFRTALISLKNELSKPAANKAHETRQRIMLERVEAALKRLKEKTYGICRDCLLPILRAELLMRPYTTICHDCRLRRRVGGNTRPLGSGFSSLVSSPEAKPNGLRYRAIVVIVSCLFLGLGLAGMVLR